MDYQQIKQLAKDERCKVKDLLALSPANDPFYTGRPSEQAAAKWFADLWERFGYGAGVHLRRIHYQAVSQDPPLLKPNGDAYENTFNDWRFLTNASKWARYLGYVDAALFVDRRNPSPTIHADYHADTDPSFWVGSWQGISVQPPEFPTLPHFNIDGYDNGNLQPHHVEIWVEKTTMNDVLLPLCERYGINLVTGAGEISITAVVEFLQRVEQAGRPARILYISDYDPAGLGMPISIARKIKFLIQRDGLDIDVRLHPIALTRHQVQEYRLPRVPVKDTDRRKAFWEEHHGQGQVELDAIEAIHPGELGRLTEEALLEYHDDNIDKQARAAKSKLRRLLKTERDKVLEGPAKEWAALEEEYEILAETFIEATEELQQRVSAVYEQAKINMSEVKADMPPVPEGCIIWENEQHLFSSHRPYFDQLTFYQDYRNGQDVE